MAEKNRKRRQEPAVRRTQILEAAKRAFRTEGLQKTTVERIAADAGVSVGLLYRFFKSKAAIVEAVVEEEMEGQDKQAAAALEQLSGEQDRFAECIVESATDRPTDYERLALMFEISAEVCRNRKLQEYVRKTRKKLISSIAARIEAKGVDREAIDQAIEKLNLASAIASGLSMHAVLYADSSYASSDTVRKLIKDALFREQADN